MSSKIDGSTNRFQKEQIDSGRKGSQSVLRGRNISEKSQKELTSEQVNTYGARFTNVLEGSKKNVEKGIEGMVCGVFKVITGGTFVAVGTGTVLLSDYTWTGVTLIVGGIALGAAGALQALIESVRATAGFQQGLMAPVLAINPSYKDSKNTELPF